MADKMMIKEQETIATTDTEIQVIQLIMLLLFLAIKYLNAMKNGQFKNLFF